MDHRLRWGDLLSPKAMYSFTLGDAWASVPTLLAMAGLFLTCIIVCYTVKRVLGCIFLRKMQPKRYILSHCETCKDTGLVKDFWREVPVHTYESITHLVLETLFFFSLIVSALFAAAVGDINIWQSSIGLTGIGIIITYIFAPGLQQLGSGYFVFLNNAMSYGEYWELKGGGIEGRVCNITPFYVEFESFDKKTQSGVIQRCFMSSIFGRDWERNFYKEKYEKVVSKWEIPNGVKATKLKQQQQRPAAALSEIKFE